MDDLAMHAAAQAGLSVLTEHEVLIAASPEQVWHALTAEIGSWWNHSFGEQPHAITLEARVGGRFFEAFDDEGNGALYGTVIFCKPPQQLKFVGAMGMANPVLNQSSFELVAEGAGTRLKQTMQVFGVVPPEIAASYQHGWKALLGRLKSYVEDGVQK